MKKGRDAGEIYSLYSYEYNKKLMKFYKRIEELNQKLNDGTITMEEKKELGTFVFVSNVFLSILDFLITLSFRYTFNYK